MRTLALLFATLAVARGAIDPLGVAVVGSSRDPSSVALARDFARSRGVPESNVILLDVSPSAASLSWPEYSARLLNPLRDELLRKGLLAGKIGGAPDARGRLPFHAEGPQRLNWIVLCRGVPWIIRRDPGPDGKTPGPSPRSESASVDSELALLALPDGEAIGHRPNPWFGKDPATADGAGVVRTARIDGPTDAGVRRSLAGARLAEARGLRGRAYIDLGGPYRDGDTWLGRTADLARDLGFPTDLERTRESIGPEARFDAPALYFGWYQAKPTGKLAEPDLRLAPGAIAFHLHSFSAVALRDAKSGWTGSLVEKGAGLTFGNAAEPYLGLTLRPDLMLAGLAQGMTAGEASWAATPAVSWMGVIVGDPFYRPFATPLHEQLDPAVSPADAWTPYPFLRAAEREQLDPEIREALLITGLQRTPSLAGLLAFARHRHAAGKPFNWPNRALPGLDREDTGLLLEAAVFLKEAGKSRESAELVGRLRERFRKDPARLAALEATLGR